MFRRYMIVCWILFALFFVVGAVGGLSYWHHNSKLEYLKSSEFAALSKPFDAFDETPRSSDVPEGFVVDEPESGPWEKYRKLDDEALEQLKKQALANAELRLRYQDRSETSAIVGLIGAGLAAIGLLWNIFCHTVHWIWMGRTVK